MQYILPIPFQLNCSELHYGEWKSFLLITFIRLFIQSQSIRNYMDLFFKNWFRNNRNSYFNLLLKNIKLQYVHSSTKIHSKSWRDIEFGFGISALKYWKQSLKVWRVLQTLTNVPLFMDSDQSRKVFVKNDS